MVLDDKCAIVTGAGKGIGRAIALKLAKSGVNMVVAGHSIEDAAKVTGEIKALGRRAVAIAVDVTKSKDANRMVKTALDEFGKIDILVNNAGITRDSFFHKMEDCNWQKVIDVNIGGMYNCTRMAIENMRNNNYGRIINISSVVGISGNMGQTNYAASKSAVIGFTKSLALESASKNITVNAIAPGFIETDMTKIIPDKIKEKIITKIPAGRFGKPEDIASIVAYLSQEEANYITGQVISVNGGYLT